MEEDESLDAVSRKLRSDIFNLGRSKELSVRKSVSMVEGQLAKSAEEMEAQIKDINEKHRRNMDSKMTQYDTRIKDLEQQLQERCNLVDQLKGRLEEARTAKKEALTELEQCRQQHRERIDELVTCINESKEKLILLERERERRKSEVNKISQLQVSLEDSKEEIKNLKDNLSELEKELDDKQFEINQLETEKQRVEERMTAVEKKNQSLNAELEKFMDSCKNKVETEDSVRQVNEWDETKRQLYVEQVRIKELETQASDLHKEIGMLKIDVRYHKRTSNEMEAALTKEKQQNEQLLQKFSTSEKDTCTLGTKVASLELEVETLKNELDSKAHQITVLSASQGELNEEKLQLKNDNMALKNELAILQLKVQENQHLKSTILDKNAIIEEKTDAIDVKSREVKKLQNNIDDLKKVLKVLDDQQHEFTTELQKQLSAAKELENVNEILKKENLDVRGQLTECRKELNESKSLKAFTEQRLKATENENQFIESRVQQQLNFLTASNEELAVANAALTTKVTKLETENVQLNTKIATYIKEKEQLATDTEKLTNIVFTIQEENITLKTGLKETLRKAETYKDGYEKYQEVCRIQELDMGRMQLQMSTTIEQQEKLIDYLREQLENKDKKKKKGGILFTPKRSEKEGATPLRTGTPLTRALVGTPGGKVTTALGLEQEQLVVKMLEDNCAHLRNHLDNLTSAKYTPVMKRTPTLPPPKKEECVLLKEKSNTIGGGYGKSDAGKTHRFNGTRCERTEKCLGCPEPIYRGMSSVFCEECKKFSHPTCASTVGRTCGKIESAVADLNEMYPSLSCNIDDRVVTGNVSIRTERMLEASLRHLKIVDCNLLVFTSESSIKAPVESFPLNEETTIYFSPPESDNRKPPSKVERACTMKIEVIDENHKATYLYMFHKSRHDMRYWIRGIERNNKSRDVTSFNTFSVSSSDDEKENQARFGEKLLFQDQRSKKIYVNSIYWLAASKVYLLGCDDGLYSLKNIGGKPVKIEGPQAIYQIDVLQGVKYAVFIEGPTRALTTVYLGTLKACAEAAECSSPKFNSELVPRTKDCYLLATRSKSSKDAIVAAASKNSLLICSWIDTGLILVKQEIMKVSITALLMTEHSVLCGNQNVLEIDTKTFEVEDFLDMTDESIYYVQIVNESHGSYPVAILDVTRSRGAQNQSLNAELEKFMDSCKNKVETEDSVRQVNEWDETKRQLYVEQVRIKELETQASDLHKEIGMLKIDVRYHKRTSNEMEAALTKEKQQNEQLLQKFSTSEKDTCTLGTKVASLELEVETLKNELDSKAHQITVLSASQGELNEQKLQLKNDNMALKNELAILQLKVQENQHLKSTILDKNAIIEEKTDAIDVKSREVKKLQNNIDDLKKVLKVLDDQQHEFTTELQKQLSAAKELENVNEILKKENLDVRGQLTECRKELNESKSLKAFTEQRLKATENENQFIESRVQQQLNFLTASNEELAVANAALTTKVTKLETENVQLNTKIATYIKEKEQLATDTEKLTNIVFTIQEENITLKTGLKETLRKAETYKDGYEKYQEVCRIQELDMGRMQLQMSTTIEQQEKLIDYLREQLENKDKKKKKGGILFTPKRSEKEGATPLRTGTPLTRALVGTPGGKVTTALGLEQEQLVVKMLEDNCAHLRNHLDNLTSAKYTPVMKRTPTLPPPKKEECVLLKEKSNTIGGGYGKSDAGKTHRFNGTRCERTEKCLGCPEPIYRGMSSVFCEECKKFSHPTCASTVGRTCGKIESAVADLNEMYPSLSCNIDDRVVTGNVSIRTERMLEASLRHLKIVDCNLLVFTSESSIKAPVESFPLNEETTVSPYTKAFQQESDNRKPPSKVERACTMKIEVIDENHKATYLYMFHKSRHDMRYWIRGIERNNKSRDVTSFNTFSVSSSDDEKENQARFGEKLLFQDQRSKKIYVNSIYWLAASKVYLLGCDDGLYSLKNIGGKPVKIEGPQAIYQIDVLQGVKYAVFIEGPTRALTTVYLGTLKACAEAAECSSPKFNSELVPRTKDCYLLATRSKSSKDAIVAAASKNSLLICSWIDTGLILVKQEIMKVSITALLMTEHSVLCGNQNVLEIDTKTFEVEDFLDMTDESIYYVQIVNESHGSYPVAILDVTRSRGAQVVDKEFLICFQDIGIFVDSFGRRSRAEDLLWSHVPLSFEYRHPYLYIFHFESVEVQLLDEKSYTREPITSRVTSKVGDRNTVKKVAKYRKILPEIRFHPVSSKSSPTYVGKGASQNGVVYYLNGVQSAKMIELSTTFST